MDYGLMRKRFEINYWRTKTGLEVDFIVTEGPRAIPIEVKVSEPSLKNHKVLIFTEFSDTARYLAHALEKSGIAGVEQVDGSSGKINSQR